MVIYGFTGSQKGADVKVISDTLKSLKLKKGDIVVTGACIGVDAQVSNLTKIHFPYVRQVIIVPYNKSKVDENVFKNGKVIYMSEGTDYRDRNEVIVEMSDKMIAFWTGEEISGTYMTMNIAKKEGKPLEVIDI